MSLRTRLILAFFVLSVVPLGAVTFYSYSTNVAALRDAAEREADLLAGELGQRMELVTAQLAERVEHLMDLAELQAEADAALSAVAEVSTDAGAAKAATGLVAVADQALGDQIAQSLGEAAMLLNNVQLQNMRLGVGRSGRSGQPPVPPGTPPTLLTVGRGIPTSPVTSAKPAPAATVVVATPTPSPTSTTAPPSPDRRGDPARGRGDRPTDRGFDPQRTRSGPPPPGTPPPPPTPQGSTTPQAAATASVAQVTATRDASGRLLIDMAPVRREMLRQALPPDKRLEDLKPEERQKLAAEVNARMLGIAQGIQIGAAEFQKQAIEAEKAAVAKATAQNATKAAATKVQAVDLKRRSSFSGKSIDVKVERDGEVVRSMNAEINLPNLLATVFSTTKRDRGELPFAVAKDGTLYARTEADKARVAAFGAVATPDGPAVVRLADWMVVTTADKSGSGMRLGVARPVGDSLANLRGATARNAGLGLLFIVIALVGIVPLSASLTRNLSALSAGVDRIAHGDYSARVPVKSKDEVGQLAQAFNQMAGDVERHQHTAVEQERIRRELELGRQIQNEMLPQVPLTLGLTQVQGVSVPAREVGGDFFNYFVLDDGQIALLMGDVSGKGVGAALLMANIQASLRIRLGLGQNLAAVADALDRDIEANSPGPVYATLFIGMLAPGTRKLRYVNAGHNPQYALRSRGRLERLSATGLPVGLLAGRGYLEESIDLDAGDQLFFYTDGCVEMENEKGEAFGQEQLEAALITAAATDMPLRSIEGAIAAFRGSSEPLDDATLMTVKVG